MPALDGLRTLGAVLVFCVHYGTLAAPWVSAGGVAEFLKITFCGAGHLGVDIFFAISGFLIYGGLLANSKPLVPYIRRRLKRLYPAFLAVLFLYLVLSILFQDHSKLPRGTSDATLHVIVDLLMLPGIFVIPPIISVCWSLSYELLFYVTMPILFLSVPFRRWHKLHRVLFFCLAWALVYSLAPHHLRSTMFIVGILVYETLDVGFGIVGSGKTTTYRNDIFAVTMFLAVAALATVRHFSPEVLAELC